ncbi:c-type cytochrome [Bradyrhizobium sp. NP1]|uniref:c-type cytochrome n=1 Tax=Bradyrhizobium sp. NP1 TaxID=3049772 RepID=UPI0025A5DF33|nr:c-type cytochrome [Bradyrhizobium sp. NP1]WJR81820.1 c-type cytochrome [Bradyrhizobium sp. NP1]
MVVAAALLAGAGVAVAQDSAPGKVSFAKCQACHAVGQGAKNKLGPELNGLAGRKAGAAAGYQYSSAFKNAGFTWDQSSFAAFMQNPRTKVPGNKMAFAGMKDQAEIAGLWAYLLQFNADGSPE